MDLSYFNARVKGFRGRLLREPDYRALMSAGGLDNCLDLLKSTYYGPYIDIALIRNADAAPALSSAFRAGLSASFGKLWTLAPMRARLTLKAVFASWEAYDLKTVVRGMARGAGKEDIFDTLIPAGEFDSTALNMLLSANGLQDVLRYLETWGSRYALSVKDGLDAFEKDGDVSLMEINIDRASIAACSSIASGADDEGVIKDALRLKIDALNLSTLIKLSNAGFSEPGAGGFFLEGGLYLSREDFLGLFGLKDAGEAVAGFAGLVTDRALKAALRDADPEDADNIEDLFDRLIEKRLKHGSIVGPSGMFPAVSYMFMKAREVRNLRLIMMSKTFGMPHGELERLIAYPV